MSKLIWKACMAIMVFLGITFGMNNSCNVVGIGTLLADNAMPMNQFEMFTQNNITFYDPNECLSTGRGGGFSSSICGSAPAQKYWSALRQHFDEIHAAAVMGSIVNEGTFGVTRWEIGVNVTGDGGTFKIPWNTLFNNCKHTGRCGGVGAFGITWTLSPYLQYVNQQAPELIKYFQTPSSYSFAGDKALANIGEEDFNKLVELEIDYVMSEADIESFTKTNDLNSAADWWTMKYENCKNCCGNADADKSCQQIAIRRASAQKALDEFTGYSCGGGGNKEVSDMGDSLNVSNVNAPDITLIGDSIAVQSEKELLAKFPNGFFSKVGSRHSTSAGMCPGDEGGLSVLRKLSSESGTIIDQHWTGECESVSVGAGVLAKNVVWELGTNSNGANENTINEVISLIGKDRNLFLVTPYNGQNLKGSGAIADIYKKVAEDNPNVYIVDWRAAVENEPSKYVKTEPGMTVHPTDEGKKLLADLIYQAVTGEGMTGIADCNASVTGTAGEAIKETAIRMSWPEGTERSKWYHNSGVPEEFTKMAEKWGYDGYPSCSRFASMVILESGVDDKFESILRPFGSRKNNLYTLEDYFASSPNWKQVSYEESQPGDIIINHEHVEVYIGDDKKAHAGEVGSPSPLDNNGPHIDPLSERDKHGDYKWYRSTNSSGSISVSGSGAGCNVCSADGGGGGSVSSEIGEGGLTFEQAKQFMMNYGANKNNSSKIPVQKGGGSAWGNSGCNGDGGSNCVAFSAFFIHKFTDSLRNTGSGHETAKNMSNVDGKGQEPKVWAVFSGGTSAKPHTGVILGYHDGEWIVGHASCHDSGRGAGTGGDGTYRGRGTGVGFVIKSSDLKTAMMNYNLATPGFAYPKNVNVAAIEKYLETGE